ncbi:MAG: DeoR/GlpR family DNA-binding transcription regulator [Pelagimonas sp.]|uniref:DeoR/GlpR family DNA-binding transcription regulator n=1 Tax=Pelagimonas sp. TaxID=2073170 RepID=UPI003D6B2006
MRQTLFTWICPISYSDRQNHILLEVQKLGFLGIEEMADRYCVSPQTIRRDVNILSEAGELRRVRGGVDMPVPRGNLVNAHRSALNAPGKKALADLVAAEVEDGSSLAVSIGTTPQVVVEALIGKSDLNIFTNNLNVAMLASAQSNWSVTIPGGTLRAGDRDVLGPAVENFFGRYCVDFGIFGVGGVGATGDLLDFTEEEVACRAAIQASCNAAFLVLDRSKFGRRAHVRGGDISSVHTVFCDAVPPPHIVDMLCASGTGLVTPQAGDGHE